MRRNGRSGLNKEQIIMLSASGFVIMALTLTGVYVSQKSKADSNDGYNIDFSSLEGSGEEEAGTEDGTDNSNVASSDSADNPGIQGRITESEQSDLDADPEFSESGIPASDSDVEADLLKDTESDTLTENSPEDAVESKGDALANISSETSVTENSLNFSSSNTLQWPIVGNVLLNYSMDQTIYFPTLDVYKYNPAIVIEAVEQTPVTAAANAVVLDVFYNEEIGNAITMNIGDGYELTYGQLDGISVKTGDGIQAGDVIAYVAAPTKYYSVEGCNVYFKLTKDGTPVNPLSILE